VGIWLKLNKNHIQDAFYGKVLKVYKSPSSGTQDLEQ
jgi:hypothetical protein